MNKRTLLLTLAKKRRFTLKVEGTSMLPILQPGDVLTLVKTGFNRIRENDVVLVIKNRQPMIHRVIYKGKNYLVTRGDHARLSDGNIKPNEVYAKVVGIKRGKHHFQLEDFYLIQSSRYFQEIHQVCEVFQKEKINFVLLKGLPLHLYYEKKNPQRIYADYDLLIDPDYAASAQKVLKNLGYSSFDTSDTGLDKANKSTTKTANFIKRSKDFPISVDLHFEPVFLFQTLGRNGSLYPEHLVQKMTAQFLAQKRVITLDGHQFPILSPSDLTLYLMLHFFHHNFRGFYRLSFLSSVVTKEMETLSFWKKVEKDVTKFCVESVVYPTLALMKHFYALPIPHRHFEKIKQKKPNPANVFNDQTRIKDRVEQFVNLFILSPNPFYKKILVFTDIKVITAILKVIANKIKIMCFTLFI